MSLVDRGADSQLESQILDQSRLGPRSLFLVPGIFDIESALEARAAAAATWPPKPDQMVNYLEAQAALHKHSPQQYNVPLLVPSEVLTTVLPKGIRGTYNPEDQKIHADLSFLDLADQAKTDPRAGVQLDQWLRAEDNLATIWARRKLVPSFLDENQGQLEQQAQGVTAAE